MLLLNAEEVQRALPMPELLAATREAYRELGAGTGTNRPRSDIYVPTVESGVYFLFKSMEGALPGQGVLALRINSSRLRWGVGEGGTIRKGVAGNRYVGLVLLFDTASGELLMICPDRALQRLRVGATQGVAADCLARPDAATVGVLGSGGQARAILLALACVRRLSAVQVYSPNTAHCAEFAAAMGAELGGPVRPADRPEAVAEADMVCCATSSVQPVCFPEWLRPGTFVNCVKAAELAPGVLERCAQTVVHTRRGAPESYLPGADGPVLAHDAVAEAGESGDQSWEGYPDLAEVVGGGVPGRRDPQAITCFVNNIGLGVQFAAAGAVLYRRARELGLGRDLPADWFHQGL